MGLLLMQYCARAQLWRGIAEHLGQAAPEALVLVHPIAIGPSATAARALQVRFLHVRANAHTSDQQCFFWLVTCTASCGTAVPSYVAAGKAFLLPCAGVAGGVSSPLSCHPHA